MSFLLRAGGMVCAALFAGVTFVPGNQVVSESPRRLTLQQAMEEAVVRSPVLLARRAEVEQAEGRLLTARIYPFNPELTVEGARRSNGASTTDRGVRLGQEIEIGGQRRRRRAEADAGLDAMRARLLREEHLLLFRVRAAFVEALRVRELLAVERSNTELARSLAEVARKRFDSGAVAQMEVNLAQVQVGRAERELRLAEGADEIARSLLAEVVGLDPSRPPEIDGKLDLPPRRFPSLEVLLEGAGEHRADLQSFRKTAEAARVRIELTRRKAIPNIRIEAFYGEEEGTDRLFGAEVMVSIPVFDRNQGRTAEARAAHRRTAAETEAVEIRIRREVAASLVRYQAARAASLDLQHQVLGTLQENLGLLQRSFEAGKTDWAALLVFRREFVDVQRDYIETLYNARLAAIELDLAAGVTPAVVQEEALP